MIIGDIAGCTFKVGGMLAVLEDNGKG